MSKKFEDLCNKGICDVCGQETDVVVAASSCGPISLAYCEHCLSRRLEPYGLLVTEYSFTDEDTIRDFAQRNEKILKDFYKKTVDEFIIDCENKSREI